MSALRIAALALAFIASSARAQAFAEPPTWMRELDLTETQQESLSQLYYEYAPAIRRQIQAGRRAHEDLENLAIGARTAPRSRSCWPRQQRLRWRRWAAGAAAAAVAAIARVAPTRRLRPNASTLWK